MMPSIFKKISLLLLPLFCAGLFTSSLNGGEPGKPDFHQIGNEYQKKILPLMKKFCLDCHSTQEPEGELDLEQFGQISEIRNHPGVWVKVREMVDNCEMPPEDSPQFSEEEKQSFQKWVNQYLDAEALANAGDPGPVVLRRLNNSEYNYTVYDLTGIDINPTSEFPVDGAAGEGFTNTGQALVMSPSLVTKYLDAGKRIAKHLVFLPDGFRFSESVSRRDWTNQVLDDIRSLYFRYTGKLPDASSLNRWDVSNPKQLTDRDGRVNLDLYFEFLNKNRSLLERPEELKKLAREQKLSAVYVEHLRSMLLADQNSQLLSEIQSDWKNSPENREDLVKKIRTWQEKMWQYNEVGHFGPVNGWQKPVPMVKQVIELRQKLPIEPKTETLTYYLVTQDAGDGHDSDFALWNHLRIEKAGQQTIYLKDLRAVSLAMEKVKNELKNRLKDYLAASFEARQETQKIDSEKLAEKYQLNPAILRTLLGYLGLSISEEIKIEQYLTSSIKGLAGYQQVKGWGLTGLDALAIVGNDSDSDVTIPGALNARKMAVHPRPERWIAASWKSPVEGTFQVNSHVMDAHPQCGNGVSWSVTLRRGHQKRVLQSGNVNRGKMKKTEPIENVEIKKDDLVSLVIGPRDGDHSCDLTEIELSIVDPSDEKRKWSLTNDCVSRMAESNPLPDQQGNEDVWHFHTGLIQSSEGDILIPENSLLANWFSEKDQEKASQIAGDLQKLISEGVQTETSEGDASLYQQLTSSDGPFLSRLNLDELIAMVPPEEEKTSEIGLESSIFGKDANGNPIHPHDLPVKAPSVLKIVLPLDLVKGGELVGTASLSGLADGQASVQFDLTDAAPKTDSGLLQGLPVVTHAQSPASSRFEQAFEDFRQLFPSAMCYTRIVPLDVVVSMVLFFREDDNYSRLMLNEQEQADLDRLWNELHYISQDAFTSQTVFEQLLEFASQDDNPARFEVMRNVVEGNAEAYRKQLLDSEPLHLKQLMLFTEKAYRRPLHETEKTELGQLYEELRNEEMSHEEAFRLLLARILTSPSFLYKIEKPATGKLSAPVSQQELANRLSYFLWSSLPDEKLLELAETNQLQDPKVLMAQTNRMIKNPKIRRMAIEFGCQWLHIRDFDEHDEKNENLYPEFESLRGKMYEETIRYFEDLFRNDRSVLNLVKSDYTFLDEELANLYNIPEITGTEWRRVEGVSQYGRGGILTQASILAKQSGASRTSPILRGNWLSETILGEKLPKPPPGVPVLPASLPEGLTERQLIEKHSSMKGCAKCHKRIDPYGFALENYDTIGKYRKVSQDDQKIDTRTTLADGTKINGLTDLQDYLLNQRREAFLKQFCKKLLGYSLGREVSLSDEPLIDEMIKNLEQNEYRISSAIHTVVLSRQFREIRGQNFAGAN